MSRRLLPVLALIMFFALAGISAAAALEKPEDVEFSTIDGFRLKGTFYPGKAGAPVVLLLHKLASDRSEYKGLAKALQDKGMNVLAYDARGHGESTKKNGKDITWQEFSNADFAGMTKDIEAALGYLHMKKDAAKVPVGIVGASIQSSTGLTFASKHPEIRALVMLSPGLDYHAIETIKPMQEYGDRPVFIAASDEDTPSVEAAKILDSTARGPRKLEVYFDAGHGAQMFRKVRDLPDKIAIWLATYLK